jgi:hypothetical protein
MVRSKPISLSQARMPRGPRILLRKAEPRRMIVEIVHEMMIAEIGIQVDPACLEYRIIAARTAGPATSGMARGTIKGSFSFPAEISKWVSLGKIILRESKNKIMPPVIKTAYWEIWSASRRKFPTK